MTREEIRALEDWKINRMLDELIPQEQPDGFIAAVYTITDYCGDLNKIQAAEATLTPEERVRYLTELNEKMPCTQEQEKMLSWFDREVNDDELSSMWYMASLSPRQRAEALLMTLTEEADEK